VESLGAGAPGVHVSPGTPPVQVVTPVEAHAPTPQLVATGVKSSSLVPSQSSSKPSQVVSLGAGAPGAHESPGVPATHVVIPVEAHAPTPQEVGVAPKSSSPAPSQSSSTPSQVASLGAGVPAAHVSPGTPPVQVVIPVEAQAPTPHEVGVATNSSSAVPSQSSSRPSQIASLGAGAPGTHVSPGTPALQVVTPVDAHAPTPQLVATDVKSSSLVPSQSSSAPSQVASEAAGLPGVHVSPGVPATQVVIPVEAHAPTPQLLGAGVKSSSAVPSQSSS
jgi:hypothetical protein